ncbi:hypothetical protein TSUD_219030 [Trifolium subterraneum]|uniref:RNase H type-1 domain-containing protein n=1 Tax=Trifolium subterraneum TaxID=3900 RepID=A0A2Z6MSE7_TRISU|nr:hypothetical protein TSUD_219030 [Trifolium subterraneum]
MHDTWLRESANRWVPSPQPAGVYQLSVRDLLHENYKAWNIVKVQNLFSKDVAEKILETPLVSSVREDKVVWEEERNGCYSVKSGYKLAMRYIIEDVSRLVLDWWKGECNVLSIVLYLMRRLRMSFTYSLAMKVVILLVEWLCYSGAFGTISNNVSGTTEADLVRWEKPALDWVKCNVDVAFVSGSGRTSMGLCFRDNSGHFMAGMTQWQQTVISSVEGEAWALLLAMEEARYRGLDQVQFESDSKVIRKF